MLVSRDQSSSCHDHLYFYAFNSSIRCSTRDICPDPPKNLLKTVEFNATYSQTGTYPGGNKNATCENLDLHLLYNHYDDDLCPSGCPQADLTPRILSDISAGLNEQQSTTRPSDSSIVSSSTSSSQDLFTSSSVVRSAITAAVTAVSQSPPPINTSNNTPAPKSNAAAIAGGVAGGIAGLALLVDFSPSVVAVGVPNHNMPRAKESL